MYAHTHRLNNAGFFFQNLGQCEMGFNGRLISVVVVILLSSRSNHKSRN